MVLAIRLSFRDSNSSNLIGTENDVPSAGLWNSKFNRRFLWRGIAHRRAWQANVHSVAVDCIAAVFPFLWACQHDRCTLNGEPSYGDDNNVSSGGIKCVRFEIHRMFLYWMTGDVLKWPAWDTTRTLPCISEATAAGGSFSASRHYARTTRMARPPLTAFHFCRTRLAALVHPMVRLEHHPAAISYRRGLLLPGARCDPAFESLGGNHDPRHAIRVSAANFR